MAGTMADYAENKVLDHNLGKTAFTKPTAYISVSTADILDDASGNAEPDGTGDYARITTGGADWNAAAAGSSSNANDLSFPISTAAWSTGANNLTHFGIWDAVTAGNLLYHADLTVARAVNAADIILRFSGGTPGDLVVTQA